MARAYYASMAKALRTWRDPFPRVLPAWAPTAAIAVVFVLVFCLVAYVFPGRQSAQIATGIAGVLVTSLVAALSRQR